MSRSYPIILGSIRVFKLIRFRTFGSLRYARITMDAATGRARGTGFACFWNKEDADKVVEQSELLRAQTTGRQAVVCAVTCTGIFYIDKSLYYSPRKTPLPCHQFSLRTHRHPWLAASSYMDGRLTLSVPSPETRLVN